MVTYTKLCGTSLAMATFEVCKDWPFDDGRSAQLYMVKHFEKTRRRRIDLVDKLVATKGD